MAGAQPGGSLARLAARAVGLALPAVHLGRQLAMGPRRRDLVPLQHRSLYPRQRLAIPGHGRAGRRRRREPRHDLRQHRAAPGVEHRGRHGAGRGLLRRRRQRRAARRNPAFFVAHSTRPAPVQPAFPGMELEHPAAPLQAPAHQGHANLDAARPDPARLPRRLADHGQRLCLAGRFVHTGDAPAVRRVDRHLGRGLRHRLPQHDNPQRLRRA